MDTLEALQSGRLAGQKQLKLACDLAEFPPEILGLADSLEFLNLCDNRLSALPNDFGKLHKLKIVFFNNNNFTEFPEVLSACPNLLMASFKNNKIRAIADDALAPTIRWLTLTNNQLETIPATIGKLGKLQKLMLAGNHLKALPDELQFCKNLELIRLAANQLQELPVWLQELPRLSWLAYAGNPFCNRDGLLAKGTAGQSLPEIPWNELEIGPILGQGASGIIYKGLWKPGAGQSGRSPQEVAVKLFKGEITSDGSPLDEMQACIAAGNHPHLVTVLGEAIGNPEGKSGLVFEFLSQDYAVLGNPPSLDSRTRDTYPEGKRFALAEILAIAGGIAAVVAHLHENGIMHGDLYAHNILVDGAGNSILSDFGAASFYNPTSSGIAKNLELMEVRAFGCLLEDLLDRYCSSPQDDATVLDYLLRLQQDCLSPSWGQRPRFASICRTLESLQGAV